MTKATATRGRPRFFDRDAALHKAMDVFWLYGYEGASLSLLTGSMGIKPPSLYAAFGSKENLFMEAVELYVRKYGSYREVALTQAPDAKSGITELFERTVEQFYAEHTHKGCFVVLTALSGPKESADVQRVLSEERRRTALLFESRLLRGQAEGDVAQDVDVRVLAEYFTTLFFGLTVQIRDGVDEKTVRGLVKVAMSVM